MPKYEALLEAVKKAKYHVDRARYRLRDLALVSILIYTGCRIGEVLELRLEDINFKK
ncbi:tyrosine-type recombinase/integrase [Staphylothermus hellenicus]|uniref:tyrosine-type recombinase/integrase n=1 Tax=Staphylothermus hellenicus TaxID=84599 RepID=UPI0011E54D04